MRLIGSCTLLTRKSETSTRSMRRLVSYSETTINESPCDLATVTPCCCTSCGRRLMAWLTLFCTCTWAISGLALWSKVTVIRACPEDELVEEKYSRWSMPLICCSITWVTLSSTVCADAPV
ncbi:hypothetical protein D3C81_590550 [compost metagenome]